MWIMNLLRRLWLTVLESQSRFGDKLPRICFVLSPKWDCGLKRVKLGGGGSRLILVFFRRGGVLQKWGLALAPSVPMILCGLGRDQVTDYRLKCLGADIPELVIGKTRGTHTLEIILVSESYVAWACTHRRWVHTVEMEFGG